MILPVITFCCCVSPTFVLIQAGLRAVHDLGPEIRRAISGNLDEEDFPEREVEEPMHRVFIVTPPLILLSCVLIYAPSVRLLV